MCTAREPASLSMGHDATNKQSARNGLPPEARERRLSKVIDRFLAASPGRELRDAGIPLVGPS